MKQPWNDQWDEPDPAKCPDWAKESINRWVEFGVPCGHFLTACLSNDLIGAFAKADMKSMDALRHIVAYLWNEVPSGCWGSQDRVRRWREKKHAQLAEAALLAQNTKGQDESEKQTALDQGAEGIAPETGPGKPQ